MGVLLGYASKCFRLGAQSVYITLCHCVTLYKLTWIVCCSKTVSIQSFNRLQYRNTRYVFVFVFVCVFFFCILEAGRGNSMILVWVRGLVGCWLIDLFIFFPLPSGSFVLCVCSPHASQGAAVEGRQDGLQADALQACTGSVLHQ